VLHRVEHFADVPVTCRGGVVSIGNFDGVHRGHVALVECTRSIARQLGGPAVAFTFDPHPVNLLRPEQSPAPLTWTERKAELLHACGADEVVVIHTNMELLRLTADEFFEQVVQKSLGARALVEGPNFGFGRNRSGTITTLNRLCAAARIQLEVIDPLEIDGQEVSSSRIRRCLADGQVELAAQLIGRPHRVRGHVVTGARRGSKLGFPTANLEGTDTVAPADGVYACRVETSGQAWPAAVHIGPNATFGEVRRSIEAHLIGFAGDLVGRQLEIDFLARLRGTQTFGSPAELVAQMHRDVEQATSMVSTDLVRSRRLV
jgi:riboflavin kinase/FMN adenylyltransferase